MTYQRQYTDAMLDGMQSAYGTGYLSPGGAEEVNRILVGLDITGKKVLDLGCGVGGASFHLRQMGAGHVLGVDVEVENIRRAATSLELIDDCSNLEFRLITPGALPFDDESFVEVAFFTCRQFVVIDR